MTRHSNRIVVGLAAFLLVGSLGGCITMGPSRIALSELSVAPPSLMVAKKSPRTAYLVLDPARVQNELPVLVDGTPRGGTLGDVSTFLTRDLKNTFSNYFERVEVVAPGAIDDVAPHAIIDVKVERVEVQITGHRRSGAYTSTSGAAVLTWGLGLRLSESSEYLYSFAGQSAGSPTESPKLLVRTMFESAITDMLKGYTDKHVHDAVLAAGAGDAQTPAKSAASEQ